MAGIIVDAAIAVIFSGGVVLMLGGGIGICVEPSSDVPPAMGVAGVMLMGLAAVVALVVTVLS